MLFAIWRYVTVKKATRILIPIMILLVSTMLAGCGGSPDKTVARFLDAFRAMDSAKMSKYVVGGDESQVVAEFKKDSKSDQLLSKILGKMTYKVQKPVISNDTATVSVIITCVDVPELIKDVAPKAVGQAVSSLFNKNSNQDAGESTMELMEDAIRDSSVEMTTVNTEFALARENGKWLIDFSDTSSRSFIKAVTGNVNQIFGN